MVDEIEAEIGRIDGQDPRTPVKWRRPGQPFRRMDSPLYRIALRHAARAGQPSAYLEIGVKEGHSAAIVVEESKSLERLILCDFFTINEKKRGHQRKAAEMIRERGFAGEVEWLDGSSTLTVPTVQGSFGLVGVDGSHRRSICEADLHNVRDLVEPGGHVVVDDLTLFDDHRLEQVFDEFARANAREWSVAYKNTTFWPGVGVLRRDR